MKTLHENRELIRVKIHSRRKGEYPMTQFQFIREKNVTKCRAYPTLNIPNSFVDYLRTGAGLFPS